MGQRLTMRSSVAARQTQPRPPRIIVSHPRSTVALMHGVCLGYCGLLPPLHVEACHLLWSASSVHAQPLKRPLSHRAHGLREALVAKCCQLRVAHGCGVLVGCEASGALGHVKESGDLNIGSRHVCAAPAAPRRPHSCQSRWTRRGLDEEVGSRRSMPYAATSREALTITIYKY